MIVDLDKETLQIIVDLCAYWRENSRRYSRQVVDLQSECEAALERLARPRQHVAHYRHARDGRFETFVNNPFRICRDASLGDAMRKLEALLRRSNEVIIDWRSLEAIYTDTNEKETEDNEMQRLDS